MNRSLNNDVASGLLVGGVIGLTVGAFYRLLLMTIGIPAAIIKICKDPAQRFHFMYYPAIGLTP